ncbi:hypothetical protein Aau02nite_84840 [Amorphoplanes auranticolor]|uniref:Uncharacterized protein n=1 Tax=Actinoplanes auranticolor TaxID=47988 RepID=A0A919SXJ1_9ACTN|nr:hypothetical protein Aau02nite_84840 [Actinoplanes auranticolor]
MRRGRPIRERRFTFTPAGPDPVDQKRPPGRDPAVLAILRATPLDIDGSR